MWGMSLSLRIGRFGPALQEDVEMTAEFETRINQLVEACKTRKLAEQNLVLQFSKLLDRIVQPSFKKVAERFTFEKIPGVTVKAGEEGEGPVLRVTTNGHWETLRYKANARGLTVEMLINRGEGEPSKRSFPVSEVSDALIEEQIESFLKSAIRTEGSGGWTLS